MSTGLKRQVIILEELQKSEDVHLDQFKKVLKWQGASFSKSSFYRDIECLEAVGFVIEKKNGLFKIIQKDSKNYDLLSSYFKHMAMSSICKQAIAVDKDFLKYIDFEKTAQLSYFSVFNQVFEAICNRHPISFKHTSYYVKDKVKSYNVRPYYLKEYKNRWYIVGEKIGMESDGFRAFGLDRITNLLVDETQKVTSKYELAKDFFNSTVGLNTTNQPAEHIRLSFDISQRKYLESLPIHHSQKEVPNDENRYIIDVFLTYNYELKQELLKYGHYLKVISPDRIKEDIKQELENALNGY